MTEQRDMDIMPDRPMRAGLIVLCWPILRFFGPTGERTEILS